VGKGSVESENLGMRAHRGSPVGGEERRWRIQVWNEPLMWDWGRIRDGHRVCRVCDREPDVGARPELPWGIGTVGKSRWEVSVGKSRWEVGGGEVGGGEVDVGRGVGGIGRRRVKEV
jgi:hypothetical protein